VFYVVSSSYKISLKVKHALHGVFAVFLGGFVCASHITTHSLMRSAHDVSHCCQG
jgi:hypothetical protein